MIWYTPDVVVFEDIQDVEEWLAPFEYEGFWRAVEPWDIGTGADRAHFDQVLAKGRVPQEKVLRALKTMARVELQIRFGLADRIYEPTDAQYLRSTH